LSLAVVAEVTQVHLHTTLVVVGEQEPQQLKLLMCLRCLLCLLLLEQAEQVELETVITTQVAASLLLAHIAQQAVAIEVLEKIKKQELWAKVVLLRVGI
jgi:hypothetical protein